MRLLNFKKITAYILLMAVAACAPAEKPFTGVKIGKPYEINGKTYVPAPDSFYDKIGDASWYGPGFDGKRTASGEIFDEDDITAAHPTLPMPSLVRVTNMGNSKSIVVRINDRGPFHSNRIIDLSKRASQIIDVRSVKPVRVQFLKEETDEYISSIEGKSPKIDMVAYNENYNKKMKEKNLEIAAQMAGGYTMSNASNYNSVSKKSQEIEDSAPLQSVVINDLEEPVKKPYPAKEPANLLVREARADEEVKLEKKPSLSPKSSQKPVAEKASSADKIKGKYFILAGSFASKENATKLANSLDSIPNYKKLVSVDKVDMGGKEWWRVHIGGFADKDKAKKILEIVHDAGAEDAILKAQ